VSDEQKMRTAEVMWKVLVEDREIFFWCTIPFIVLVGGTTLFRILDRLIQPGL